MIRLKRIVLILIFGCFNSIVGVFVKSHFDDQVVFPITPFDSMFKGDRLQFLFRSLNIYLSENDKPVSRFPVVKNVSLEVNCSSFFCFQWGFGTLKDVYPVRGVTETSIQDGTDSPETSLCRSYGYINLSDSYGEFTSFDLKCLRTFGLLTLLVKTSP